MNEKMIFQYNYPVDTMDLNMHHRLRSSRLLELVQHVSGLHAEALGLGEDVLLSKDLAWVVVRQKMIIHRLPGRGETMCFTTWPGRGLHGLFPRYLEIKDEEGQPLADCCFVWVILNRSSREMVQPAALGLEMPSADREALMPLPRIPKAQLPEIKRESFTVPYHYIDFVGHMNNARYLDTAENFIDSVKEGAALKEAVIEYAHELLLGETMELCIGREGNRWSVQGKRGDKTIVSLFLEYA